MAINLRCACGSETKLANKVCPRCGEAFTRGNRKYKVTLRMDGKKVTRVVDNLELARETEAKLKIDITRGELSIRKKKASTLQDVWERYEPWALATKKTAKCDIWYFKRHLGPRFASMKMSQISAFDIEKMVIAMRKEGYANATIKHQTVLLSRLFTLAANWGLYEGPNPCKRIKPIKLNNQITESLTGDELSRLLDVLKTWPCRQSASLIEFLLYTGLRKGEALKCCSQCLGWLTASLYSQALMVGKEVGSIIRGRGSGRLQACRPASGSMG